MVASCLGGTSELYASSLDGFALDVTKGDDEEANSELYVTTLVEVQTCSTIRGCSGGDVGWHVPATTTTCPGACLEFRVDLRPRRAYVSTGSVVRVRLRESNPLGLEATSPWREVVLDDTPPEMPADLSINTVGSQRCATGLMVWCQTTGDAVSLTWTAPGFVDGESTLRTLEWTLYTVSRTTLATTRIYSVKHGVTESRQLAASGQMEVDAATVLVGDGLVRGVWYEIVLRAENGAGHASERTVCRGMERSGRGHACMQHGRPVRHACTAACPHGRAPAPQA